MLTGVYAVRNMLQGERNDLWSVTADVEYLEHVHEPRELLLQQALATLLSRLDPVALGAAVAAVSGVWLALATLALLVPGGAPLGPHLALLAQYLPGYSVSLAGSALGLGYGLGLGFLAGWSLAQLRNAATRLYVRWLRRRSKRAGLRRLLDEV